MNRMGIPQPDYTPDGVLAEIARVVPFFKGAVWEKLGDNSKQWPIGDGCTSTEILHPDTFATTFRDASAVDIRSSCPPRAERRSEFPAGTVAQTFVRFPLTPHKASCIVRA